MQTSEGREYELTRLDISQWANLKVQVIEPPALHLIADYIGGGGAVISLGNAG